MDITWEMKDIVLCLLSEDVVALKGLIFKSFFLFWEGVVILKGLISDKCHFGRVY